MLYVDIPTVEGIAALASYRGDTCVSIYLPIRPVPAGAMSPDRA
jgi:hypothetical protein